MSWLKTAVNKAVEAGGKTAITRTVRNFSDTVVLHAGQAVVEGAKILHERIAARNLKSFKLTVKRLEDLSVSCRGIERVQLLRRWLVALKEVEKLMTPASEDKNGEMQAPIASEESSKDSPKNPVVVYYVDPDLGTMNFREMFLYSQALEGITLSMILEAPNDEEVQLLLEIFGLCLEGGKEIHTAIVSTVQDLAKAFSTYEDEVLIKKEELLHYAQDAIAGLKTNADVLRIDAEANRLRENSNKAKASHQPVTEGGEAASEEAATAPTEDLKEMLEKIQTISTLEELLIKKKSVRNGDSTELHAQKLDKLKVLSESLLNSTKKAESRILDHRSQKEEALNFRVAKAKEVNQLEKELTAEIGELEKQKNDLEAQLKKVNASLSSARARLHNAREERDNFDEASNEILIHLKAKEEEVSRSISSCRTEADIVIKWVHFIEDTWALQTSSTERKKNQVDDDLRRHGDELVDLVVRLLSAYKEDLETSIVRIRRLLEDMDSYERSDNSPMMRDEGPDAINRKKNLEQEYLDLEARVLATFSNVDTVEKKLFVKKGVHRKDEENNIIKQQLESLEKMKTDFDSIKRPMMILEVEEATAKQSQTAPSGQVESRLVSFQALDATIPKEEGAEVDDSSGKSADIQAELERIEYELGHDSRENSYEDFGDWISDETEKDIKRSSS